MGSESLLAMRLRTWGPEVVRERLGKVKLASFVPNLPEEFLGMTAADGIDFLYELTGRPEQLRPDGNWRQWIFCAGRGAGKTWAGSVATIHEAQRLSALVAAGRMAPEEARLHVVAATASDLRDVITEGPAGLLRLSPPWFKATFEPSKRRISWPGGVQCVLISADEPERARGLQCCWLWCDEFASWRFADEIWPSLLFGLRLGPDPRAMITTTPRPGKLLRGLLASPSTVVSRARTADNLNLAASAIAGYYETYGNTRLGLQELDGELLTDNPAALWKASDIDAARVTKAPDLRRTVVAVDPAVTSREDSDETGIIIAGLAKCRCRGKEEDHVFVVEDVSGTFSPDKWARVVAHAYERHGADRVVAEINQGGDLVQANLRTVAPGISYRGVRATKGKAVRAEPVAALYEQGKVHHVGGFPTLEAQLTQWNPQTDSKSPDRLDALVWALTDLIVRDGGGPSLKFFNIPPGRINYRFGGGGFGR